MSFPLIQQLYLLSVLEMMTGMIECLSMGSANGLLIILHWPPHLPQCGVPTTRNTYMRGAAAEF